MNTLLAKRDFFALKDQLSFSNKNITTQDSLYFQASVQNAFGQNEQSIAAIRQLGEHYATQVEDDAWINLLNILADNYAKMYDYKSTAASYAILLRRYGNKLNETDVESYDNDYTLYKALEKVPAQTIIFQNSMSVQMRKDQQELWNVPILFNKKDSAHFVFDSGAGISTITNSAARKLGLQIIPANIKVNSANDRQIVAQLGIADEMQLGGAVLHHVVFLVMDDRMLDFPTINYTIDGIIGFPVINALHNITISKNGVLKINNTIKTQTIHSNFYYQGNAIRMHGIVGKDTLFFHLDTGAKQSELNKEYYDANKSYVRSISEKKKYHLGGAGGVTSYKAFQLPNVSVQIGSGKKILPYIPVYPTKVSPYGNAIGQDYIQLFDQMQIDFENCYINFR